MAGHRISRRVFLTGCGVPLSSVLVRAVRGQARREPPGTRQQDLLERRLSRIGESLSTHYPDLRAHFIFEYYPWYGANPWVHWNGWGHTPPSDIAATAYPALGPYDSRARSVIEQHAQWIRAAGAAAVNLSWWGPGSREDQAVDGIMDVMHAYGIQVAFYLEPYRADRVMHLVDDVKYLVQRYGERRHWDAFLLLANANGSRAPLFKTFGTFHAPSHTDCLGRTTLDHAYYPDEVWYQQTTRLRRELAGDFDRITLLADSLSTEHVLNGGFDGGTTGDPFVHPDRWPEIAGWFDAEHLLFAFAVNPGFEAVVPEPVPNDPCYRPLGLEPPTRVDWSLPASREEYYDQSVARIRATFERTVALQTDLRSENRRRGFFVVYLNSFNEWHEGTAFEPAKSYENLTATERRMYHNPTAGGYRLAELQNLIGAVT
jgi:hypothetical protein